jgi:hypothetical protein
MALTAEADATTSGDDGTQPRRPERISAPAAVKPPNSALFVPAARTPNNRIVPTAVTSNSANGTADPNRKKLPIRTAAGFWAKKTLTTSPAAKGLMYGSP